MDYKAILEVLQELFEKLVNSEKYPNGRAWDRKSWAGWTKYNGHIPRIPAVYVFYSSNEKKPVYIGQTIDLGKELNRYKYRNWDFIRFIDFTEFEFEQIPQDKMRKLLERFAITVLKPIENID